MVEGSGHERFVGVLELWGEASFLESGPSMYAM